MGSAAGTGGTEANFTQTQRIPPQQRTLADLAQRALLGSLAEQPNTPIPVPFAQSIGALQSAMPFLMNQGFGGGGLASRLAGGSSQGFGLPPGSEGIPTPQFGAVPTREELGLPDRRENFPGLPTFEELEAADLVPPIRQSKGTRKEERLERRLEPERGRLEERIARRGEKGRATGQAERKLGRIKRRTGPTNVGGI